MACGLGGCYGIEENQCCILCNLFMNGCDGCTHADEHQFAEECANWETSKDEIIAELVKKYARSEATIRAEYTTNFKADFTELYQEILKYGETVESDYVKRLIQNTANEIKFQYLDSCSYDTE